MVPVASALPAASIVLTAHNAERFVRASVSAALMQDYPSFEVVLLDDGSTDRTESICRAIRDPRFRYIRRERVGRARALNEAVHLASGEFIAINDVDDLSLPGRLSYCIPFLRDHPRVVLAATAYVPLDQFCGDVPEACTAAFAGEHGLLVEIERVALYRSNPLVHSTVVFRKDAWRRAGGYDESLSMCIDYDFFLRLMAQGTLVALPKKTVLWYRNTQSFFKRMSEREYLSALRRIRRRARVELDLPMWTRALDLIPWYLAGASVVNRAIRRIIRAA
jgi:glycosyltransferase involved in cell wall biosynthesis